MLHRVNFALLIGLIFCLSPMVGIGQQQIDPVKITILDLETNLSLPGATALNLKSKEGEISNLEGVIYLNPKTNAPEDSIEISFLGYIKQRVAFSELPDSIFLEKDINSLEGVTIVSTKELIALTTKAENITDFVMNKDNILLLSKTGRKPVLKLTELDGELLFTLDTLNIDHIERLFTSCFETHFLVGRSEVLQLHIRNETISIVDKASRTHFDKFILPCKLQNENYLYMEKKRVKDQIASILGYSKDGKEQFNFSFVADDKNLDRYQYDAPYMDFADGIRPMNEGIHATDHKGRFDPNAAQQWGNMLKRSFYMPVDYFMLSHQNKVLLFDHEKLKLNVFSPTGQLLKEHPIDYPKHKDWKSEENMYFDKISKKLYGKYRKGKYIYLIEIDLETGASIQQFRVEASFIEKFAIHDDVVYYTNSSVTETSRILKRIRL